MKESDHTGTQTTLMSAYSTPRNVAEKIPLSNSNGFFISKKVVEKKNDMELSEKFDSNIQSSTLNTGMVNEELNKIEMGNGSINNDQKSEKKES